MYPEEKIVPNFSLNQGSFQSYGWREEVVQVHLEEKQSLAFSSRHGSNSFGSRQIFCSISAWITLVTAYAVKLCDKMEQKLKLRLCKLPGKGRDLVYWVWMLRPGSSERLWSRWNWFTVSLNRAGYDRASHWEQCVSASAFKRHGSARNRHQLIKSFQTHGSALSSKW